MLLQDEGRDNPTEETPSLSPAERFARLLSQEDSGEAESDTGAGGVQAKPDPVRPAGSDAKAEETASDGDDETTDAGDQGDQPPVYRVPVDGEEVEVTLDELKKGYSFTAHNTRKAQALAAERKAFEAEQKEIRALTEQYRSVLPKLEEVAQKAVDEFAGVDWDALRRENPAEFAEQRAAYQLHQEKLKAVQEERQAEEAKAMKEQAEQFQSYVVREQEALLAKVPEWKDEAKRTEEQAKVAEFAVKQLGFTAEELGQTFDHRVIQGLRLAWLGAQVLANAEQAGRKVGEARRTARPGKAPRERNPDAERLSAARGRLKKSGKMDDAAEAIAALFAREG